MKRTVVVVTLMVLILAAGWTQEGEPRKTVLSIQAGGLMVAPVGLEAEFFLGRVGLCVETRLLLLRLHGEPAGTLEPGVNLRFYSGEPGDGLFVFTGAGFLTVWRLSPFSFEQGIVKPRAGFGYARFFGSEDRWRLAAEVGAGWLQEVLEGDLYEPVFPLLPHLLLVLGRVF
ncbi:MAG: hypothetical protein JXB06_15690 [Spirochaetales bacterium]|nr:hypothetical protein [Spirochaetales bacterium]